MTATLTALRDLVPLRALTRHEALGLAERQAMRLAGVGAGDTAGSVDEAVITGMARIHVERVIDLPDSGQAEWVNGRWIVLLRADEPNVRQRFTLAHEFKHILDDRFMATIYAGVPEGQRDAWRELVCDYFAGCLLMPRPWIKRAWTSGIQDPRALARMFDVSAAAVRVRLHQLGLTGATRRHPDHRPSREEFLRLAGKYQRTRPSVVGIAT